MQFSFNHKPVSKDRPRFGAKGKVYNPQKEKALAYKWEAAAQARLGGLERPLESPICFGMRVYVPMPKSWSKKRKEKLFKKPVESRPDIDNNLKWYMDVLTGIAYKDDKLVTQGFFEKLWDYEGKVEINITQHDMSLQDEIEILGRTAVKLHCALDEIYQLVIKCNGTLMGCIRPDFCAKLKNICLDAGLDEIYPIDEKE